MGFQPDVNRLAQLDGRLLWVGCLADEQATWKESSQLASFRNGAKCRIDHWATGSVLVPFYDGQVTGASFGVTTASNELPVGAAIRSEPTIASSNRDA